MTEDFFAFSEKPLRISKADNYKLSSGEESIKDWGPFKYLAPITQITTVPGKLSH